MAKRKDEEIEVTVPETVEPVAVEVAIEPPSMPVIADTDWETRTANGHRYLIGAIPGGGYVVRPASFTGPDFMINEISELENR